MSARGLVVALRELQSVLCICPCCGELFRLSEARLFYASPPRRTWFDDLQREKERLQRAEDRFEEERQKLGEMSRQSVERKLRRALRERDPVLTPRGYYPKDARPLLDPVDFVVFDGMNLRGRVREVVLLDHVAEDRG
ncbi:MAG: Holliday junction resolvase-like protein, partial [Armatimonadota bacterium]|nr:Holliday junction resolvase-like protein [Armatimonadota bacterium]